ncbi:MAG: cytochrome c-type biogenesis protein CcmH [Rhodobacterales bacterium]|jgi:cytochrome c-type biogenesis protein CcmH
MRYVLILFLLFATPVFSVQPDEVLTDPVLESRARDISQGLRCLVCRNESIDDSNAGLARDLRLLVRERIMQGDSDTEVVAFVVSRYGEYVLLRPEFNGSNLMLWAAGPLMLGIGGLIGFAFVRRRRTVPADSLTAEESARLTEILRCDVTSG